MWALLLACAGPPDALLHPPHADAGPDLEVPVGEPVALDGSGSRGVSFTWHLGDGAVLEGASVTHTWEVPGRYAAVLQVTGEDGTWRTDTARVVVYEPPAEVPPSWSATLALDVARGRLWAVTPEADLVTVVDLDGEVLARLPTCGTPRTVAVWQGEAAVACEDGALERFDADALDSLGLIELPHGSRPHGVAGRGEGWWVSLEGLGALAHWHDGALTLHEVGPDPRAVAIGVDGAVFASRFRSIDGQALIYVLGGEPIALGPDPGPDSDNNSRGLPNLLAQLVISPEGRELYAMGLNANVYRGLWRDGLPLTHETALRGTLRRVDLPTRSEDFPARQSFDDQDQVIAAAFSPLGDLLYVAHPGTRIVHALDRYSGGFTGSLRDVGAYVTGLVVSPDGHTLYGHAWLDRQVRAYDVRDLSVLAPMRWSAELVEHEPLDPVVLRGKRIFHDSSDLRMARDGYLHCATCHPDGREDGLVWDFTDRGEGLRNTITLEGRGGTLMGPLHWSGNFDEVQDFEGDIRKAFGGQGFLSHADWEATQDPLGPPKAGLDPDLDALAAYVSSLVDTPPSPHPPDAEGEALFFAHGCHTCHPPPLYTDSSLDTFLRHDVGTLTEASGGRLGGELDGLDTPTLLGAWSTGPWLHDGSATTVQEAIAAHTDAPPAEDLVRIAAFVLSL